MTPILHERRHRMTCERIKAEIRRAPPGARNKKTIILEALLESEARAVATPSGKRKAMETMKYNGSDRWTAPLDCTPVVRHASRSACFCNESASEPCGG